MRRLVLIAGMALAVGACTSVREMPPVQRVDWACASAVTLMERSTDIARYLRDEAARRGKSPAEAQAIIERAEKGEDVVLLVCPLVTSITQGR